MADVEKKVLLNVEIKATEALKNLTDIRGRIELLRKEQAGLDKSTESGRMEYERLGQQIKVLNKEAQGYEKQIQNTAKANREQTGSLEQLKAQLSLNTAAYSKLSDAQKKTAEGKALQKSILDTTNSLKEQEKAMGNTFRNVGNYGDAFKSLPGPIGGAVSSVQTFSKSLWALVANPIGAVIAAIVAGLYALYSVFKSTDSGATAFASTLKALGNVMDVIIDRGVSFFKMLWSIATFDFKGIKQNAQDAFGGAGAAIRDAAKAGWEYEQQMDRIKDRETGMLIGNAELRKSIEELKNAAKDQSKTNAERLAASEEAMKKEKELLEREKLNMEDRTKAERDNLAAKIQINGLSVADKQKTLDKWLAIDGKELESAFAKDAEFARFYNENEDDIQNLQKLKAEDVLKDAEFQRETRRLLSEQSGFKKQLADEERAAIEKARSERENNAKQQLDLQGQLLESMIKAEAGYQSDDFETKLGYAQRLFALSQKQKKDDLDLQLKYGKIKQDEYNKQNQILANAQAEFDNAQMAQREKFLKDKTKEVLDMLQKDAAALTQETADKYKEALKTINESDMAPDEKKFYSTALRLQYQKEIEQINADSIAKQIEDIEKAVNGQYDEDMKRFSDNEIEKNRIAQKSLEDIIAKKKAAGLSTLEDEAKLRVLQSQGNMMQLNLDLLNANLTAKQKYEINKEYLEKELEINKDNAAEVIRLNAEMAKSDKEYMLARIENVTNWAKKALDYAYDFSAAFSQIENNQLEEYAQKNERQKEILKARFDAGLISQDQYDDQVERMDKELDRKKTEIAIKQAKREKLLKTFSVITSTASAIARALYDYGFPFNLVVSGIIASLGAVQLQAVQSAPLPKASRGMLLKGKSHAQGGIPIEAEGGEAIINARSTQMYKPLLSAINEAGGGVKFAGGGIPGARFSGDGGYSVRNFVNQTTGITQDQIESIVRGIKVYASIEDIRRGDKNYAEIESRASY